MFCQKVFNFSKPQNCGAIWHWCYDKLLKSCEVDVVQLKIVSTWKILNWSNWRRRPGLNRICFIKPCSLEDPKLKAIVSKFDAALRLESNSPIHQLLGAISPKLTKIFNPGYTGAHIIYADYSVFRNSSRIPMSSVSLKSSNWKSWNRGRWWHWFQIFITFAIKNSDTV